MQSTGREHPRFNLDAVLSGTRDTTELCTQYGTEHSIPFLKSLRPLSKQVGKLRVEITPSRIGVELLSHGPCILAIWPPMTLA